MWKVLLAAVVLVGAGVFGMCFNILFRKGGEFPQSDVGSNENMRKMGIRCMKEEEDERLAAARGGKSRDLTCSGDYSESCSSCSLYGTRGGKRSPASGNN